MHGVSGNKHYSPDRFGYTCHCDWTCVLELFVRLDFGRVRGSEFVPRHFRFLGTSTVQDFPPFDAFHSSAPPRNAYRLAYLISLAPVPVRDGDVSRAS
jgi:hypothetical protein